MPPTKTTKTQKPAETAALKDKPEVFVEGVSLPDDPLVSRKEAYLAALSGAAAGGITFTSGSSIKNNPAVADDIADIVVSFAEAVARRSQIPREARLPTPTKTGFAAPQAPVD